MFLTDLYELKTMLEIDPSDTNPDKILTFFIEQASKWIEEVLNRELTYKTRTQYYQGTGTQKLLLRCRPVYTTPAITVVQDQGGLFGAASNAFATPSPGTALTYGVDYTLQIDWDSNNDGTDDASRSGILIRVNDYWFKPQVRQTGLLSSFIGPDTGSYKITYTAGYTVDNLPPFIRFACDDLVARMYYLMPLGVEMGSENYIDRGISVLTENKQALMAPTVKSLLWTNRNWKW